jgi:RNase P subunit RPR2
MMEAAESAGSPYLLTRIEHGYSKGSVVLWKEKKSIRCKKCGNFLNARPPKFKATLTHRMVGVKCAASG